MSDSDHVPQASSMGRLKISVGPDPGVIEVYGPTHELLTRCWGSWERDVPPGIYEVVLRSDNESKSQFVRVPAGRPTEVAAEVEWDTIVPTHKAKALRAALEGLGQRPASQGRVTVVVQRGEWPGDLPTLLHGSERAALPPPQTLNAGDARIWTWEVPEGAAQLVMVDGSRALWAKPGWHTVACVELNEGKPPTFFAILRRFGEPWKREAVSFDLAALYAIRAAERGDLPPNFQESFLRRAVYESPFLAVGFVTAWLQQRSLEKMPQKVSTILDELRSKVAWLPDVPPLDWLAFRRGRAVGRPAKVVDVPFLMASLEAALGVKTGPDATETSEDDIIEPGSPADRLASQWQGAGAWSSTPTEDETRSERRPSDPHNEMFRVPLSDFLNAVADPSTYDARVESVRTSPDFDPTERRVGLFLLYQGREFAAGATVPFRSTGAWLGSVAAQLCVPRAMVRSVGARLMGALDSNDPVERFPSRAACSERLRALWSDLPLEPAVVDELALRTGRLMADRGLAEAAPAEGLGLVAGGWVIRNEDLGLFASFKAAVAAAAPVGFFLSAPTTAAISGLLVALMSVARAVLKKGTRLGPTELQVLMCLQASGARLTTGELAARLDAPAVGAWTESVVADELRRLAAVALRDGTVVALVAVDGDGRWGVIDL